MGKNDNDNLYTEIEKSRQEIAKLQERIRVLVAKRRDREAMAKRVAESVPAQNSDSKAN